jgi:PAS domain-containing protein
VEQSEESVATKIEVLIVEDSPDDAELIVRALKRGGYDPTYEVVDNAEATMQALEGSRWDVVLSDFNIPGLPFADVLEAAKTRDPDRPIIVVSGAIGEEGAVSVMRSGASDLVLKTNLARLVPAIQREVAAAQKQYARRESEQRFRDVVTLAGDWVWETDTDHRLTYFSDRDFDAEWAAPFRSLGKTLWEVVEANVSEDEYWGRHKANLEARRQFRDFRISFAAPSGQRFHVSISGVPVFDHTGAFRGYRGTATDETAVVEAFWRAEEAEAMLRDAVESISEGLIIADAEDRIVMVNEAHHRLCPELEDIAVPGTPFSEIMRAAESRGIVDPTDHSNDPRFERLADRSEGDSCRVTRLSNGRWVMTTDRRMQSGGIASLWMDVSALKDGAPDNAALDPFSLDVMN